MASFDGDFTGASSDRCDVVASRLPTVFDSSAAAIGAISTYELAI